MTGKDRLSPFSRSFRTIFDIGAVAGLTDGELLDRFAIRQEESAELAFAALMERHGPMVLRVCRKVLGDSRDPLDAFQATFLVLVRRARSVRKSDSIASWLHGVAYRVALAERSAETRRLKHERIAAESARKSETPDQEELGTILHGEIDRLPDRYRAPLVLCHLEGMTHEQAADRLGWPVGTVKSRMSRGRDRLKARLIRRGLEPSGAWGITAGLPMLNPPWKALDATAQAATRLAAGQPIAGMVPASALTLMQGVLKTMTLNKIKLTFAGLLALGIVATAANVLAQKPEPIPSPRPVATDEITYETRFAEMTGYTWREEFHKKLKIVSQKGSKTVWAVDPETLKAILAKSKGDVQTPKVTAFRDAKAIIEKQNQKIPILDGQMIMIPQDQNFVVGKLPNGFDPFTVRPGNHQVTDEEYKALGVKNFISDGLRVELSGHRIADGVLVQGVIESQIIVSIAQLRTHNDKEIKGDKDLRENSFMQVPETIESRLEGEWLIPVDGALIVGMGVHRFPTRWGMSEIRERLIVLKASELPSLPLTENEKKQVIPQPRQLKAN
jgi:RNA polymerase sigma factor (sigma-70 family)